MIGSARLFFFAYFATATLFDVRGIPIPDLATAQAVAQGIANINLPRGNTKLEACISDAILPDHSRDSHPRGRSYFRTSSFHRMLRIVQEIIRNPDRFIIQHAGHPINRDRLIIYKTFTYDESHQMIRRDHIGYTMMGNKTNTAQLVFDITDVATNADYRRGGAITGYPI